MRYFTDLPLKQYIKLCFKKDDTCKCPFYFMKYNDVIIIKIAWVYNWFILNAGGHNILFPPHNKFGGGGGGGIYLDLAVCKSVSPGWVIVGTTPLNPLHMVCQIRFDGNMHLHTKFQDILWMKNDYEIVISHNLIMKIINDNFFASLHAVLFFFF